MLAIQGTVLTVGWVIVWFLVLAGGVWQVVRGRSGAGACLGGAAILGLGLYMCGGGVVGTVTSPLHGLAGPMVVQVVSGLLIGCVDAVVLLLVVLGATIQRPTPGK